jgi:hypothetical protein
MLGKHRVELTGVSVDQPGQQTADRCGKGACSLPQRRAHNDGCSLPPRWLANPLGSRLCRRNSGQQPGVGGWREPNPTADQLSGNQLTPGLRGREHDHVAGGHGNVHAQAHKKQRDEKVA